jgi:hypothetical protein
MENPTLFKRSIFEGTAPTSTANTTFGINNQIIIIVLLVILGLTLLGINIFIMIGDLLDAIIRAFGPIIKQILSIFGYTTGSVITKTADIAGDVVKTGVDVAEGSLISVGTILKDASRGNVNTDAASSLDTVLNSDSQSSWTPAMPSSATNPIQRPITASKGSWCLVGEYEGKRGCIEVNESNQCLSKQLYKSKSECVAPTTK